MLFDKANHFRCHHNGSLVPARGSLVCTFSSYSNGCCLRATRMNTCNNDSSIDGELSPETLHTMSSSVYFWLYLVPLVPSTGCSLVALHHLLFYRAARRALNNHVIIVLLLIDLVSQLTIFPWMLVYYGREEQWDRSLALCAIWGFIDWGLYLTQVIVFSWASIERHILIFHDRWVSTRHKRFVGHYLPLIVLLLYCLIFYGLVYFFPPCENSIRASSTYCITPCLYKSRALNLWESIVHQIIPNTIIVVFNVALLVRTLWRKYRLHQAIQWRKHRKMTIQLLSISLLYLIFSGPNTLLVFLKLCNIPDPSHGVFRTWGGVLSYYQILIFPMVCMFSLPDLLAQLKRRFGCQTRSACPATVVLRYNPHIQALRADV